MDKFDRFWAESNRFAHISFVCLALSILSLFLPLITYTNAEGSIRSFNLISVLRDPGALANHVFTEYTGEFLNGTSETTDKITVVVLGIIGAASIIMAIAGLLIMSYQTPTKKSFALTLTGLIGTAIPAAALLSALLISHSQYEGTLTVGAYMYITPITMILSCVAVTRKHKLSKAEQQAQKRAERYIQRNPSGF